MGGEEVDDGAGVPPSAERCGEELERRFPGRGGEVAELLGVLGEAGDAIPPVLVYGGTGTGKTAVVRAAMALLRRPHAYVSCRAAHAPRLLFESALDQLAGHVRRRADGYASAHKCDRLADFVALLGPACAVARARAGRDGEKMVYLVLDDAQLLRGWPGGAALLASLISLPRLAREDRLGVVFVGSAAPDAFQSGGSAASSCRDLLSIYFRDYTNEELYSILVRWRPYSELYSYFLRTSLTPFSRASRVVTELSESLHPLFDKFCEPVLRGKVQAQGRRELFTYVKGHMQAALSRTHSISESGGEAVGVFKREDLASGAMEFHLPLCSKYLLLASYIASRNPATLDDALFGTGDVRQTKKRKRKSSMSAMEKRQADVHERQLKGPGNCPLERLLAIYQCVAMDGGEGGGSGSGKDPCSLGEGRGIGDVTADVLMQLTSLASVNLVLRSATSPLDGFPRFRSNMDADFIHKIANSIQFPLSKYLLHG